ncbi:GtrA family protein [Labedella endophytica]|uniref:GtrA family protein n=1 Tax=Labedella endophytica TaxID=1523160 RepID=A0A433JW32_9MICO|nr:GtrA family protein [Labedella endophytica]RUR03198.1 GtrA family protein [Labedella endophytica]
MARLLARWKATIASLATFGGVGAIAFVVDLGVYNVLRATVLEGSPIWSKVASVAVATVVAWIGNRLLTFRATRGGNVAREAFLFAVMNVGGLLIAAACLFVSHYVLGFTSQLADNIAGNGVGLVLGTAFRYIGYRYIVFRPARTVGDNPSDVKPPTDIEPDPGRTRTTPRTGDAQWRDVTEAGGGTRIRPPRPSASHVNAPLSPRATLHPAPLDSAPLDSAPLRPAPLDTAPLHTDTRGIR